MADEAYDTKRLLALRKLTRAVADLLRNEVKDYLGTLTPLLRPQTVFGNLVDSPGLKESVRGADAAFKDVQDIYARLVGVKPFMLPRELKPPLEVKNTALELSTLEYGYAAKGESASKTVVVSSPLRWVVSYGGYGLKRLYEVATGKVSNKDVLDVVLHTLLLHVVVSRQAGVGRVLQSLRFPASAGRLPGLGDLPVTFISAPVTTLRPPDDVIIENTEISGSDAFEEVVDLATISSIGDPLQERLLGVARQHGPDLLPG